MKIDAKNLKDTIAYVFARHMGTTESEKMKKPQETEVKSPESVTVKYLMESVKQLQSENESLKLEIMRKRHIPSDRIAITFVVFGMLSLIFSIYSNSPTLAFIGLGLTFWGALFFLARPVRYVRSNLLDSTAISSYTTIDRIIKDLNYKGKSYYIPPYPKDVYLPEHLAGLKDMIVYISADSDKSMPTIEEMAKGRFLFEHPKGISVIPPGLGLLIQFENELKRDITKMSISELCEILPRIIIENSELAREVEMQPEGGQVYVRIFDQTYKNLYSKEENLKSVHFLGSPLVSAIACAIAKTTGKIVTIQKDEISQDGQTIQVWYQYIEG